MAETLRGVIEKVFFASPDFSAGLLRPDDDKPVRFCGKFCAAEGDLITAEGKWQRSRKYGPQFAVERLHYDLPESPEGLVQYLAKHPAFKGIGQATAQRIVDYTSSGAHLDRLLRTDLGELHEQTGVNLGRLRALQEAWIAHSAENEVRSFLASFDLTPRQMDTLLERFGEGVVGILRQNPYQLIRHVKGYGFKKVDQIARNMSVAKDHPGRIEAALAHCVHQAIDDGHTWISGSQLIEQANELLLLDALDSRERIQAIGQQMLANGTLVAEGTAISTPGLHEKEQAIHAALTGRAWAHRPLITGRERIDGLTDAQAEGYQTALRHPVTVISGGAGTGKTYVVARLAATLRAAGQTVALCAPTGKAAKRIEQVLRDKHGLELGARTIHRLLGYNGRTFERDSLSEPYERSDDHTEPAIDIVIVDEVSMVDVPLMAELIERIDLSRTRLVLVGDHNQLPPVGPGNVLRDLISHELVPTVVLNEVQRQAGVLEANSTAVLSGKVMPSATGDSGWTVIDHVREPQQIQIYLRDLVLTHIPQKLGYDPLRDVQIIAPTHIGRLGTKAINEMMQHLVHGSDAERRGRFVVGDKVIQTANDYDLGVMNGTIGYVTEIERDGITVDFEGHGLTPIDGEKLGKVQLAYALTAHKAQGSEFPCAVVICHKSHFFTDRNWLYTAVTRAAESCILVGDRWGLRNAAQKNRVIARRTFLSLWAQQPQEEVCA